MAEEYKNVPEHETPKIATEESSATTGEVKDRGLFDFLGKKEEVKPQETPLESDLEHKTQLIEQLHEVTEEEKENKPSLIQKLHRSNSSSSSSSEEEGEDGEKRKKKKENKKIVEGGERTEEEKQGIMDKIKEKLPGHGNKPEDGAQVVVGEPVTIPPASDYPIEHPVEHSVEHPAEKKGILEKIKEKLPGHHAKSSGEEEKKEKESE